MADWRKLALEITVAHALVDLPEIRVLRRELCPDGTIDREDLEFLIELRALAKRRARGPLTASFESFFLKVLFDNVARDGIVRGADVTLLRKALLKDVKPSNGEKRLLQRLRAFAHKVPPTFDKLYEEAMKG